MTAALRRYHTRMRRVLDHIDRHLAGNLDLDTVSGVAAFSKFHFHRQFTATFGVSLYRYVQLARMKQASYRLAYRGAAVTTIAMDAGYDAPDAFARAFRRYQGQSPSGFRHLPDWDSWHTAFQPLDHARHIIMQNSFTADAITIREVSPTPVAILTHLGPPAMMGATIRRFIAWRKATGLTPPKSATFNIFHTDLQATAPNDHRIDLCAATYQPIDARGEGVVAGVIPGGRCAVLRVVGGTDDLEHAARYLYREWLPASGEEARDFPLYCQRVSFFPDVAEHEAIADLFLPLR